MTKSNEAATIIATSSLELGIDIGDLQIVIQVNSTNTVSSLKQRLGRSGRKKMKNNIYNYTQQIMKVYLSLLRLWNCN